MNKRRRALLWVVLSLAAFVLLVGFWAYVVVFERPPYEFMRGARQDGFLSQFHSGSPIVSRSYALDRECGDVLAEARRELYGDWTEHQYPGETVFANGDVSVVVEPLEGAPLRTSIVVTTDATKIEELLGTTWDWLPDRYEKWR